MSEEIKLEATALHPTKWYVVDGDTDEPLNAPDVTQTAAQKTADSKQWGRKKIAVKQGKDVKWKPGQKESPMVKSAGSKPTGTTPSVGPSSVGGKKMEQQEVKEAHELVTPVMTGTPEERLEALNLWTGIVTSLKKISELPSNENKTSLLRAVQREAQCVIERVLNVVQMPAVAHSENVEVSEDATVSSFKTAKDLADYVIGKFKNKNDAIKYMDQDMPHDKYEKDQMSKYLDAKRLVSAHFDSVARTGSGLKEEIEESKEIDEFASTVTAERLAQLAGIKG